MPRFKQAAQHGGLLRREQGLVNDFVRLAVYHARAIGGDPVPDALLRFNLRREHVLAASRTGDDLNAAIQRSLDRMLIGKGNINLVSLQAGSVKIQQNCSNAHSAILRFVLFLWIPASG